MNRFVFAAAAAVLLLAGCGDDSPTSGDDPTSTVSPTADVPTEEPRPTPTPDPTPDPTPPPTPEPTPTPTDPDEPVPQPTTLPDVGELIGIPEPGVEAGCWLLDGYLLLGGDQELIASGREVRITGSVARDVMTTCQQGIPYNVETVVGIEPAA